MNSAERVFAALKGDIPDRVPIIEWFVHPKVYQALVPGSTWPDFVDVIGLDAICGLFLFEGAFKETQINENTFINEWGVTLKLTDEYKAPVEGPIKSLEDIRHYIPPDPNAPHRLGNLPSYVERFKGRKAVIWAQRADFMWAAELCRLDEFLADFVLNPKLVHEVLEMVAEFSIALARRAIRAGADIIMLGDDYAFKTNPMMSPTMFKEFILPRLTKVVRTVKDEGAFCIKHSDGNIWPILDMIIGTGVDGINPLEPIAGMDIELVKRKYGNEVCLIGNIDCGHLLSNASPEEVERTVMETIRIASPGGRYIVSSSNTIHSSVKPENYKTMIEATHRYGVYHQS